LEDKNNNLFKKEKSNVYREKIGYIYILIIEMYVSVTEILYMTILLNSF